MSTQVWTYTESSSVVNGGYVHICEVCGRTITAKGARLHHMCYCQAEGTTQKLLKGPGDYLHNAILNWVGEGPTRKCGCQDRINKMNVWGVAGCKEHLDEIVDWLMEEAGKRNWWKVAAMVPGSRYFVKQMVLGAIEQAEAARLKETTSEV